MTISIFRKISIIIVEHFFYNFILNDLKEILGFDKKGTFFLKDCLIKVTIFRRANPLNLCPA